VNFSITHCVTGTLWCTSRGTMRQTWYGTLLTQSSIWVVQTV